MSTQKIKCTADYNYKWPNRARTALKAGFEGSVKIEVAKAAIKAGAAEAVADPTPRETPDGGSDSTKDKKPA